MSPESSELSSDGLLLVGRVARAHGIRGHVIVNPETDFMEERFRIGQRVVVGSAGQRREYEIQDVRFHRGRPVVRFAGVDTMNEAETLSGSALWLREAELEPLPAGTYYRHDLLGCEVRTRDGELLGRVTAVEGTLDRSCLVIDEHVMIPLVADICVAVDIVSRRVTVDPPDGLIDLNRPTGRSR